MTPVVPAYLQAPPEQLLERVLEHWRGRSVRAAETGPDVDVPPELIRYHEVRSQWALPLDRTCHLVRPEHVGTHEHEPPIVSMFLYEEQGVQAWGYDADGTVWTRVEEDGEPWRSVGGMTEFLVAYELVEGAMGALGVVSAGSSWLTTANVDLVLAPLAPLPLPVYLMLDSPHTLYGSDDVLALAGPNPFGDETATGWEVWLTGRTAGALDWLADIEGVVGIKGWNGRTQMESYGGIFWDYLTLR